MSTTNTENALIIRQSLPQMAGTFNQAVSTLRRCFDELRGAMESLGMAFGQKGGSYFDIPDHRGCSVDLNPGEVELRWKRAAWSALIERMELKRICSIKKAEEIDKQLADPKQLPEITEANLLAMLESSAANAGSFLEEAVREVFDKLRPWHRGDLGDGYKTNQIYQIGERVVLSGYLSLGFGARTFRVSYYGDRQQVLRCLDNVMHLLDGKGTIPTHHGPLVDAINGDQNFGEVETEYFVAKCFKNCNLHLRFKRLDLLAKLNLMGSGGVAQVKGFNK